MPNWLQKAWSGVQQLWAGSQLPPVVVPKVANKQQTVPSFFKTATPNPESQLPVGDRRLASTNIETYRTGADTRTVMRNLIAANPDLAAAAFAYLRTAITPSYMAVAKNMDGTFNRDATALLLQLLTRFDIATDYDDGFSGVPSLRSNSESLLKQILTYGSCALELVLDKTRLPHHMQPISVTQIVFYPDKTGKYVAPKQKVSGEWVDLDLPTFFYTSLDQDLLEPYSSSPFEPAIQPSMFSTEFMNDLRRIIKRAVHPRLAVKIDEEKFRKNIPPKVAQEGPEAIKNYMDSLISEIESKVNSLNPEDAFVYFDTVLPDLLNNGNISLDAEYTVLSQIVDGKMVTGAKALPSILGHGTGSQNMASSETLLFMKNAEGVQQKLNEIYSRALTLAVRLFGQDVYVEFRYAPIDLRPDGELEAFKAMKQSRVLEQLSLGFITDDEASIQLTGQLTPAGFTSLQGTNFMQPIAAAGRPDGPATNGNPHSGTSTAAGGGNNAGQQARQSKAPQKPKGPAK